MLPSLDDLALLVAIAEKGGFTAAASAMGIPKSTVSRRLADLETLLQTSLFRRSTRALSLTDEGERIYEIAKPAIDAAREAAKRVGERERKVTGRVSITTTAALGQYLIAPQLAQLNSQYPELQIDLRLTERRINIVAEGIDLAVRMGDLGDSELVARKLSVVTRRLVASPEYLARHGTPEAPTELATHQAIITAPMLATWRFADGWECQVRWRISAGNMLVARELALAGEGVAQLPDFMIDGDLKAGRLTEVLKNTPLAQSDAWIVSSKQRHHSLAVRTIMEALVEMCGRAGATPTS
jgi:DNA-binding transcriptional LysR family regulator